MRITMGKAIQILKIISKTIKNMIVFVLPRYVRASYVIILSSSVVTILMIYKL